jgi:hypothetical protein
MKGFQNRKTVLSARFLGNSSRNNVDPDALQDRGFGQIQKERETRLNRRASLKNPSEAGMFC